jgi:hypothetical protein
VTSRVVTVPFYEARVEEEAPAPPRAGYLSPDKVTFGFLGSSHTYNVAGLKAVVAALEDRVARTFAPVDLILGGTASQAIETRLPVRRLGRVPTEAGFYAQCDIALAPTFEGTGFKIKVADMLALGIPGLVARHSAIGTSLAGEWVVDSAEEMADAMVRIARERPPISTLRAATERARDELRNRAETGRRNFLRLALARKPCLVIDLSACGPERGVLALISYFSLVRHTTPHAFTYVVLREDVRARIAPMLPLGVRAVTPEEAEAATHDHPRRVVIEIGGAASWFTPGVGDRLLRDGRWDWLDIQTNTASGDPVDLPLLYPDVSWDPCVGEIRKAWKALSGKVRLPKDCRRVFFLDWLAPDAPSEGIDLRHKVWLVNVNDPSAIEAGMMALLDAPEESLEVVWASGSDAMIRSLVIEAAVSRRQRVSGLLDGCFVGRANGKAMFGNIDARLGSGLRRILEPATAAA